MKKIRKYREKLQVSAKYEKGGGTSNVEEKQSMSVGEMYARMLRSGELQKTMLITSNNHGSIERADKLINDAFPAPSYMATGERHKVIEKMADVNDVLKKNAKKNAKENEINKEVKRRMENMKKVEKVEE